MNYRAYPERYRDMKYNRCGTSGELAEIDRYATESGINLWKDSSR